MTRKPIPKKIRKMLSEKYSQTCQYCGEYKPWDLCVDHILPKCAGGSDDLENLTLACSMCNFLAGKKSFINFYEKRQYVLRQNINLLLKNIKNFEKMIIGTDDYSKIMKLIHPESNENRDNLVYCRPYEPEKNGMIFKTTISAEPIPLNQ